MKSSTAFDPPPLADSLRVILPLELETLLLRGCLLEGEAGKQAWREWTTQIGPLGAAIAVEGSPLRSLLPLIHRAALRHRAKFDPVSMTILRTADLREQLRTRAYQQARLEVLAGLAKVGVQAIVMRGAALAELAYPDSALRHAHDVDLLVRPVDLPRAASALVAAGLRSLQSDAGATRQRTLAHPSGLPIVLHGHPFHLPPANDLTDELWTRSQQASDLGPGARVLDPADALLQTCARAASDLGRGSLHWVTDCWYLLPRQPELDWELLVRTATAGQLALPLFVMLDYLRASLWAPIPLEALRGLADAARSAPPLAREAALYGARLDRQRGTIRALLRRSTHLRSRALIVRWLLLPSPAYLDWLEPLDRSWQLPLRYLRRPARYVVRRLVAG